MSATLSQARDDVFTTFKTAWDGDVTAAAVPVLYPNVAGDVPKAGDTNKEATSWARINMIYASGAQATLANEVGNRRFRRTGLITVDLFVPLGDGSALMDTLQTVAKNAFEGVSTTNGVIFRNVRPDGGAPDGAWFMSSILADFEYDEIR